MSSGSRATLLPLHVYIRHGVIRSRHSIILLRHFGVFVLAMTQQFKLVRSRQRTVEIVALQILIGADSRTFRPGSRSWNLHGHQKYTSSSGMFP